jgi:hypothetical protein
VKRRIPGGTTSLRPSSRLTLAGGIAGLVPALGLSILRAVDEPGGWELLPGDAVFGLIYMSPYLAAIYASRLQSVSSQAPLLLAAATLSFLVSLSALSGVSVILLPATVLLTIAAIRTSKASNSSSIRKVASSLGAVVADVLIVSAFLALFLREDPRFYGSRSVSDVVTPIEAMAGLVLLVVGLLVLMSLSRWMKSRELASE